MIMRLLSLSSLLWWIHKKMHESVQANIKEKTNQLLTEIMAETEVD